MNLNDSVLNALATIIIGDSKKQITEKLTGPQIVEFFNEFGFEDDYWKDKLNNLSRFKFALDHLKKLNGKSEMKQVILELVNPSRYWDSEYSVDNVATIINEILINTPYELYLKENRYFIKSDTELLSPKEVSAHFNQIQDNIINEIKNAKFLVWISIAWFTDPKIFSELIKKKQEGVNVQIIISDDEKNNLGGLEFEKYFETYRIPPFGVYDKNILHNKFCIIDLLTTITGSYNYTKSAQYHGENIDIITDGEHARQYANRFIQLKRGEI